MSIRVCCELTYDGLVSHPGGVKNSHLFKNMQETEDKHWLHGPLARKGFSFSSLLVTNYLAVLT